MGVSDGITSLKLGDPWWGALTKKKNVMALPFSIYGFSHANKFVANALHHLGITSLKLGDPWWGALTKKKT